MTSGCCDSAGRWYSSTLQPPCSTAVLAALEMVLLYMPCLAATHGLALHSLGRKAARWREDFKQWKLCKELAVHEARLLETVDLTGQFVMPHKSLPSLSCPCSAGGRGLMEGQLQNSKPLTAT